MLDGLLVDAGQCQCAVDVVALGSRQGQADRNRVAVIAVPELLGDRTEQTLGVAHEVGVAIAVAGVAEHHRAFAREHLDEVAWVGHGRCLGLADHIRIDQVVAQVTANRHDQGIVETGVAWW